MWFYVARAVLLCWAFQLSFSTCTVYDEVQLQSPAGTQFEIKGDHFLVDGQPYRIISCELHYFRIPKVYWRDRLLRSKGLGCNSIQTYIPWNFHEPVPGVFDFEGQRDVVSFLQLAQELDLYVLLRPGPYVCAEWDLGGLPAWLLDPLVTGQPLVGKLRSAEAAYVKFVDKWWAELLPRMVPLMAFNGGPILMVQIENEYGVRTFRRDITYMELLRDIAVSHLGPQATLYTTDPPLVAAWGGLREVFHAVDFGPNQWPLGAFLLQSRANRNMAASAPIDTEFYTGWFTHWGQPIANTSGEYVAGALQKVLAYKRNTGSVSLYMAHGGTSFGFWAGCNGNQFDITSYDYNSPISESGNTGQPGVGGASKFEAIQDVIATATGQAPPQSPPEPVQVAYGAVEFTERAVLLRNLPGLRSSEKPLQSTKPLHMEAYGLAFGMIAYTTKLNCHWLTSTSQAELKMRAYDLAQVFLNGDLVGTAFRGLPSSLPLPTSACSRLPGTADVDLTILVATYGRENFFISGVESQVVKGIVSDVELVLGKQTAELQGWNVSAMPLVEPARVLQWSGSQPETSTAELIGSLERKAFDSLHGGVWRTEQPAQRTNSEGKLREAVLPGNRKVVKHTVVSVHDGTTGGSLHRAYLNRPMHTRNDMIRSASDSILQDAARVGAREVGQLQDGASSKKVPDPIPPHARGHTSTAHEDDELRKVRGGGVQVKPGEALAKGPVFFRGHFTIASDRQLHDTFLSTKAWSRGMVWVNGNSLGRFWTSQGPQQTLYVPKVFLKEESNEVVILELERVREGATQLVAEPDFSGPVP